MKFVVVGNKADKGDNSTREVTREEGMAYAQSIGCEFYETSAKTDLNVDVAFVAAAKCGLEYHQTKHASVPSYMGGGAGELRSYVPPQRTVDLNRTETNMSDGECCF